MNHKHPTSYILMLIITSILSIKCLEVNAEDRWALRLGYANYNSGIYYIHNDEIKAKKTSNIRLEFNRIFTKFLEAGPYVGYAQYPNPSMRVFENKRPAPSIGVTVNYHVLPYLYDSSNIRFRFYLTGRVGGFYVVSQKNTSPHGFSSEYALGLGCSYNISRSFGIFADYSYGKFHLKNNSLDPDRTKFRFGLLLNFK